MTILRKHVSRFSLLAVVSLLLVACGATQKASMDKTEPAKAMTAMEIYEVHHEGRIHVFYDRKLYQEFLDLGETPYRLTRIGAGPNGETIVFGLTKDDKKKPDTVEAIKLYDNKAKNPELLYAEMRRHGRVYIFDRFEDMQPVRQFGHPNFFYTEIGAGPSGETVVYVLNKGNKKSRPDALIARYKSFNS